MSVSVIISAYNAQRYLAATIESVLNQTWLNVEIIVVDDGSTDDTLNIAYSFRKSGVKVLKQENKGQDAALNLGYKNSSGTYIKFLDSDDLINSEALEIQIKGLRNSVEHVAYGEWARFYNNNVRSADFSTLDYWRDATPVDFLTSRADGVMLQCGIMLIPRQLIEKAGFWDERLILFNDTEFFTRIILASKGVKFTPGARLYYRSALSGSISAGLSRKYFESTYLATQLMARHLLQVEDSGRVRRLISNTFLSQYYRMYPKFSDLSKAHEKEIAFYGHGNLVADGGKVFKILARLFGWKAARRIQHFFYHLGYKPVHPALKK